MLPYVHAALLYPSSVVVVEAADCSWSILIFTAALRYFFLHFPLALLLFFGVALLRYIELPLEPGLGQRAVHIPLFAVSLWEWGAAFGYFPHLIRYGIWPLIDILRYVLRPTGVGVHTIHGSFVLRLVHFAFEILGQYG
jgi:hypothetical protein